MTTPTIHEERHRLLNAMKTATDYYELAFSSAEHAGYLRGLRDTGVIGGAAHDLYLRESERAITAANDRLLRVA